jgi:hypothetical protein
LLVLLLVGLAWALDFWVWHRPFSETSPWVSAEDATAVDVGGLEWSLIRLRWCDEHLECECRVRHVEGKLPGVVFLRPEKTIHGEFIDEKETRLQPAFFEVYLPFEFMHGTMHHVTFACRFQVPPRAKYVAVQLGPRPGWRTKYVKLPRPSNDPLGRLLPF